MWRLRVHTCTQTHMHKLELLLSWFEGKCKSSFWSHHLPKGCKICPCKFKELLTTFQVLPRLQVCGMQVAFSSWLVAPFITSKALTMPSSALSQKRDPFPILENPAWAGTLLLVWTTHCVLQQGGMRRLKINPVLTKAHLLSIRLEKGASNTLCTLGFCLSVKPYPALTLQWFLPSIWPLGRCWVAKCTVHPLLWLHSVWVNFDGWTKYWLYYNWAVVV